MTKNEIIADETLFQRVCDAYVRRHIGPCVSSLMYGVGQNLEECSRIFDFDYDEALGWFVQDDWEEPVNRYIDDADLDDLETIADMVGEWAEIVGEVDAKLSDDLEGGAEPTPEQLEQFRTKIKSLVSGDEYREIADAFNLDPYQTEIYEHWIVDSSWFADQLKQYGQIVFEFGGLTIFGRCTTGQSLSLDGWARSMVRDLPEDHWVWREA